MEAEVLQALTSRTGLTAIAEAAAALSSGQDPLALVSSLRKAHPAPVATALLEQARLRSKAQAKLGERAAGMLFTADSVEQASRSEVSRLRATRLEAAGVTHITDAGAGVGADTIAYAEAGLRVTAVERDPVVAALLRHNVRALDVEVLEGDALSLLPSSGAVYFDPARRSDRRRIFNPEDCSPPLSELVAAAQAGLTVVAKMSPSLGRPQVPPSWDVDWVSTQTEHGRSVVEAVLWSPPLGTGVRRARVLTREDDGFVVADLDSAEDLPLEAGPLGRFVYEPDGAVNQAELIPQLAQELGAHLVEPRIAYLTGDRAVDTPLAHRYEVIEQLPWSKRSLARALSSYDASDLVIKKRGVTVDPTALRKELLPRLRSRTGEPLVVILTPQAGRTIAVLAHAR